MKVIPTSPAALFIVSLFPQATTVQDLSPEVRSGISNLLTATARQKNVVDRITIDSVATHRRQ